MASAARYVVFGEALTDFIREGAHDWRAIAGGSCWNVARVGARLGVATGYAGAVSRDLFGDELVKLSNEAGLDMRFMQQVDKPPFLAMVVEKNPPSYFFIGNDSADVNFDPTRLPDRWLEDAAIVHFGSISLVRQPLAARLVEVAELAHRAGKRIAFDPNCRNLMDRDYRPTLERMTRLATFIKVSDEDLRLLFPELPETGAVAVIRSWAPAATILLTRGASGMQLLAPDMSWSQPAFRVQVADTVGAGDASMGGWMASHLLAPEAPAERHLAFSAATAAAACRVNGAYAPTRAEVEALLAG
ncbi:MAG TPA: carbohydrate kinase [Burkholderiaceae bacterium]|nr:carbohydrate kinase [Burkholderiaceae bacterium]